MKIALSTSGHDLDAPLDTRFGRAARFLIYDDDQDDFSLIDNAQNLSAPQGAGIQSAQNVAAAGAQVLISGHCGPKAFRALSSANIRIYTTDAATVSEALALFKAGKLTQLQGADVGGHW